MYNLFDGQTAIGDMLLFLAHNDPVSNALTGNKILIGCLVGLLSSACQSIGLILQRKSHLANESAAGSGNQLSAYKRSLWHLGFLLFIISNVFGSTIQLSTLPLIVLSPLQSIGLVFNTVFNTLILHEEFTRQSFYGTVLVGVGAFLIALCGGGIGEPEYDLADFIVLLSQKEFVVWISVQFGVITLILFWIMVSSYEISRESRQGQVSPCIQLLHVIDANVKERLRNVQENTSNNDSNFQFSAKMFKEKMLQLVLWILHCNTSVYKFLFAFPLGTIKSIQGISYGVTSGILSAQSLLLAKSAIEIALLTLSNRNVKQLNNSMVYLLVLVFLVLCLSQLYLLNQGLKLISTSILYPLVFCVYNISSISNGLTFYRQWSQFLGAAGFFIFLGTILVVFGVFILSESSKQAETRYYGSSRSKSPISLPLMDSEIQEYQSIAQTTPKSKHSRKLSLKEGIISSMFSLTDPSDPESPYYDPLCADTSPSGISNRSLPVDLIKPIIKKTGININNASRKVSGFFRKSIDNIQTTHTSSPDQSSNQDRSTISFENYGESPQRFDACSKQTQYVSFDSLKEFKNQSAITHASESLKDGPKATPKGNKRLPNIHESDFSSISYVPISENFQLTSNMSSDNYGTRLRSDKSASPTKQRRRPKIRERWLWGSEGSPKTLTHENQTEDTTISESESPKHVDSHSLPSDDEYNPHNAFNFSLNNTIDEIQNQLNGNSEEGATYTSPNSTKSLFDNIDNDQKNLVLDLNQADPRITFATKTSTYSSAKSAHNKLLCTNNKLHSSVENWKRVYSYEQKRVHEELTQP
ncbi:hypothetical protein KL918_002977 [Ogataea parapolymorpha]|uniref:Magnesium transporter NIPA8 n=1 Tax=Ogataea parapolymorpha (strain ATCC 26012 / BCRC 20466 / JCM 22074 / NRRL Y-7560 / DL-1) TaxID=871575 RepID=W1QB99_OGAPD|nr:hypothetical protein HPODL_01698 [Ogataea parapolymorpha DL-1]ESW97603.1 hypothetical protein HPODL_01698 [Ogataea parapolymorpha DL-1]KAG7866782.1 hypothetical protein KL918_002977 [Ogataea parapolymorpha]KAG7871933.1 hypothetical protein KL916_003536 [Ogataea parapolymorpha]